MPLDHPFFQSPLFWPLIIWSLIWKGFALWRAGTLRDRWWFIAILVINTFGVLEIFYMFIFSRRDTGIADDPGNLIEQ